MSDFWGSRTGRGPAPQVHPQYAPQFPPQYAPQQQPQYAPQPTQQFLPQQPGQQPFQPMQAPPGQMVAPSVYMDGWGRATYVSNKTDNHNSACPNCRSSNYGTPPGHPNVTPRCYNCGYPHIQYGSDSGAGSQGGPKLQGAATPARQVAGAGADGGWNASAIAAGNVIGHL